MIKHTKLLILIFCLTTMVMAFCQNISQKKETSESKPLHSMVKDSIIPIKPTPYFKYTANGTFNAKSDIPENNGNAESSNLSKKLTIDIPPGLILYVDATLKLKHKMIPVYLINSTSEVCRFKALDGELFMMLEALTPAGKWQEIGEMPTTDCGNSYHNVYLNPGRYWEFRAPVYTGNFATTFRYKLEIDNNKTLYSNTFKGKMNKSLFKGEKQGHKPQGIMDSYND